MATKGYWINSQLVETSVQMNMTDVKQKENLPLKAIKELKDFLGDEDLTAEAVDEVGRGE